MNKIYSILPATALDDGYDYLGPDDLNIGDVVRIPFHNRVIYGVVLERKDKQASGNFKLKEIFEKLNLNLDKTTLEFLEFVAKYNLIKRGHILKMFLTPNKAVEAYESQKIITINREPQKQTEKQKKLIDYLKENDAEEEKLLLKNTQISKAVLKNLLDKKILKKTIFSNSPQYPHKEYKYNPPKLSDKQQNAADKLNEKIADNKFSVSVINGVTGSGKTEIYFKTIQKILDRTNKQILVLVPEILLTKQLVVKFKKRFGLEPDVWHSSTNITKKKHIWHGAISGDLRIVIGARSALFLPFTNLGLIIVDEEHDTSFKQEDNGVYQGRDMAIVRGLKSNCPIFLASATPSLETYENILKKKYDEIKISSRFGDASLPEINIINLKEEHIERDNYISPTLLEKIKEKLAKNEQVMLYLNRRGYAPLMMCSDCGHRIKCENCDVYLTQHKFKKKLICHHCDHAEKIPEKCSECGSSNLRSMGPAVEKINEEIQSYFPNQKTTILTSDITDKDSEIKKLVSSIEKGEIDIIIGTQIIAKGHHFPNLTLVAVIDGDVSDNEIQDLRCFEKLYQLLHQLAGRAGRESKKGEVYIQCYDTESRLLQCLIKHDTESFLNHEIESRKLSGMPPFGRLAAIIISDPVETESLKTATQIVEQFPDYDYIDIMGPIPAPLHFIRNKYRYRILLKTSLEHNLQPALKHFFKNFKHSSSTQIKIDIDPYNFF